MDGFRNGFEKGYNSNTNNIKLISGTWLLTIVLVILKALGYITWSWLWVFSPLWIQLALVVGIIAVLGLVWLVAVIIGKIINR